MIRNLVKYSKYLLPLFILALMSGCNATKYLEKDQYIVDGNRVHIEGKLTNVTEDDLASLARQKPNPKLLWVSRFSSWAHYYSKAKDTRFRRWIGRSMAKEPVILDTTLCISSMKQMDLYLENKGAFMNTLDFRLNLRKHSVVIHYDVLPGKVYSVASVTTTIEDSTIAIFLANHSDDRLVKEGMVFDVDILDDERERIVKLVKDYGYYSFTRDFITYRIDSTGGKGLMKVEIHVSNPPDADFHPRYTIRRIYINVDYDPLRLPKDTLDTLIVADKRLSLDKPMALYYIVYSDKLNINPDVLIQNIFIDPGMLFSAEGVQRSYRLLSELRLYRQVNIQFRDVSGQEDRLGNALDCEVRLTRAPVNAFSIETEGTNSAGDLGIAGNIVFQNRNLFRNAETFNIRLTGALEMQRIAGSTKDEFLIFNTFETGAQTGISFPRFLLPIRLEQFPKLYEPVTSIDLGFNIRQRPDYRRIVLNLSFGYEWKESVTRKHILYPADINAVNIIADSSFNPGRFGPRYEAQYSDHLVAALRYSFIYNTQPVARGGKYMYFRGNVSSSGNFLNFASNVLQVPDGEDGYYRIFGIRFAQFIRLDGDFRNYFILRPGRVVATRLASGFGIPYGNSDVLPFEQAFFAGGANSLRGWELRSLGPGGFRDTDEIRYDKIGDMLLEANIEYRFPIYSYFKGALFTDIGNVWLLQPSAQFPQGEFRFDRFASELAIDAGLGMRLDFGFFLFRIDIAHPFRDPAALAGERWVKPSEFNRKDMIWNFGIGYPF